MHSFKSALNNNLLSLNQNTSHQSFEEKLISFNNCLQDTLDAFAPLQTVRIKSNETDQPKWFDAEYRKQRRIRQRLEKVWRRLKTNDTHQQYVNQRYYCVSLANIKMKEFYRNIV